MQRTDQVKWTQISPSIAPALVLATMTLACTAPPTSGSHDEKHDAKHDAEHDTKHDTKHDGDQAESKADEQKKDSPAAPCCKYCIGGVACGDECLDAGATCEGDAKGCACAEDQRPVPQFRKGDKALQGLIAADVPVYNKAQGDPVEGPFTLAMAFEGDEKLTDDSAGTLYAKFETTMGDFECELFEKQSPLTVANFVGLVRGTRPFIDPESKEWVKRPFFEGILFHRVIDGFMIQTGDPTGTGTGSPGYFVPDEFHPDLKHVGPGVLSMANRNRVDPRTQQLRVDPMTGQTVGNTGSSQFFVTVAPTPHLDGRHAIFGKCGDAKVPKAISKVETITNAALRMDHKPKEDVSIKRVEIFRK